MRAVCSHTETTTVLRLCLPCTSQLSPVRGAAAPMEKFGGDERNFSEKGESGEIYDGVHCSGSLDSNLEQSNDMVHCKVGSTTPSQNLHLMMIMFDVKPSEVRAWSQC
jgi:hypothetical protein